MGLSGDNIYCNYEHDGGERLWSSRERLVLEVVGAARKLQLIVFILSFHGSDKGSGNALCINTSSGRKREDPEGK